MGYCYCSKKKGYFLNGTFWSGLMNIFDNLRQYQKSPRKFQPPTEEEIRQEKREKCLEWIKGSVFAVFFISFWGCLWYFAKWEFAGMIFFLVLAFLIFGIFTTSFANGSLGNLPICNEHSLLEFKRTRKNRM